ncbi:MAG: hypothetical protein M9891_16250, partial [Austwickia sp.]|nr:hypothetical protein [Austwickia sp.]
MTPQPRAARTVAEGVGGARRRGRRAGVTLTLAAIVAAAPAGCAWDANVPVQTGATALTGSAGTTTPSGGAGAATNAGGAGATTPASGASSPTSGADQTAPYPELLPRTIGDAALEVSLTRLSPSIATPDAAVSIDVTIANRGLTAAKPAVTARVGEPLSSRADLDAPLDVAGTTVVSDSVPAPDIAPQGSASVRLTIPAQRLASAAAYGVRPLLVRAETAGGSAAIRTYLPFEQRKEYEPLSLAVAVPLTQDLDPARSGAAPAPAPRGGGAPPPAR